LASHINESSKRASCVNLICWSAVDRRSATCEPTGDRDSSQTTHMHDVTQQDKCALY